jgi:hypothetical protein
MEPLLRNLVLVFLVAGGVLHLFHRLRLPTIVGLIVAGVLIGPHGFGVLHDRVQIERLAEIGILLLMFSIGLDFTRADNHNILDFSREFPPLSVHSYSAPDRPHFPLNYELIRRSWRHEYDHPHPAPVRSPSP